MGTLLSCARSRAGGISRNPLGNPTVPSRFTGDRNGSTSETVTKSNDSNLWFSAASSDGCSQRAVEQRSILFPPCLSAPTLLCVCACAHWVSTWSIKCLPLWVRFPSSAPRESAVGSSTLAHLHVPRCPRFSFLFPFFFTGQASIILPILPACSAQYSARFFLV